MNLRSLSTHDQDMIWIMLMHAAHETDLESVKSLPELARYAKDWGRVGDCGYGAFIEEQAVGAVWVRLFSKDDPGYSFVSDQIPELAIAVLPSYRGQGVGTALLEKILAELKYTCPGVSLSVRSDNQAIALYQRLGFVPKENTQVINRTGGTSFTMMCCLSYQI